MNRCVISKTVFIFLFLTATTACSLDYGSPQNNDSSAPDFVFYDTTVTRVQNGMPRAVIEAESIEQYSRENSIYGKDISFHLYNDKGKTTTEGSCDLVFMDQKAQLYTFINAVDITSFDQDVHISAGNLLWNNKTEQMTSDSISPVIVTTGISGNTGSHTTSITGTGLIADGSSRTFQFAGTVTGTVANSSGALEE